MKSVLNPEAPEFFPTLTQVTQEAYTTVNRSIKSSNSLPAGASYDIFSTFTDFNILVSRLSENVLNTSNEIVITELPTVRLRRADKEFLTEKVIDVNDTMLDRVNVNIDTINGVNKPSDELIAGSKLVNVSTWNKAPVIEKVQMGAATFIGAKNIPRPQLQFKEPVDNSDNLWVPKISDKPNSVRPLTLKILYNENGEAIGYEHPYKAELDRYVPAPELYDDTETPTPPPPIDQTPLTLVDTVEKMDALVEHLNHVKEIAVDVEHHSYRSYQGITCLIQITTAEGGDFVIDALALREHIHKLNQSFTDPTKLKVLHGASMDVIWLQRDFGVYVVGMFDTYHASRLLGNVGNSLKHLLQRYCNADTDKKYQLADWRIRPLPKELLYYAQMDTHYLLYIWKQLRREIFNTRKDKFDDVFDISKKICLSTYNKEMLHEESHLPLYCNSKKEFNSQQMAALKMLYKWRDQQARALDESTTYLLPNHMMLSLAETLPREVQGVDACCSPMPPFVKQNIISIHRMLLSCRELPIEPQMFEMPAPTLVMMNMVHQPALPGLHDLDHYNETEDKYIDLDRAESIMAEYKEFYPSIEAFNYTYDTTADIPNFDAKFFLPPYERYKKYRFLAQVEELKDYKDKEAKITALSKGDELIKDEVLYRVQQAKSKIESDETQLAGDSARRKRKIDEEKQETKPADEKPVKNTTVKAQEQKIKPFEYKNINYKKFYHETKKSYSKSNQSKRLHKSKK